MRTLTPLWSAMFLATVCSQAQAMNLSEAIQSTLDNHPEIHAAANSRLSSDEDVKFAKGGYLPTVDLLVGYGRERTDSPRSLSDFPSLPRVGGIRDNRGSATESPSL